MPNLPYQAPNGQRRPKAVVYSLGCCSVLIIAIILIAVSLKKLSSTQLGVEYDTWSKQLDDAAKLGEPTIVSDSDRYFSNQLHASTKERIFTRHNLLFPFFQVDFTTDHQGSDLSNFHPPK